MNQTTFENNEKVSTRGFFFLIGSVVAGAIAFAGMLHARHLEEVFIYKEDNRIQTAKDLIFKNECKEPREKQEHLVQDLEEREGIAALRMAEAYQNGWKGHPAYSSGEKIVKGEAYVKQRCEEAVKHASELKRADSTHYVITHFFGGR
jgi:hypothetical protein